MGNIRPTGPLILIAEDEKAFLRPVAACLARAGFRVMVSENGAAALEAFRAAPDEIALVLTDISMPLMSGTELAARVREIRPGAKVVLMSAYPGAATLRNDREILPFLQKPFRLADLIRVVRATLAPQTILA